MNWSEPQLLSHVKASLVAGAYRRIPVPAPCSVSRVRICSARRARRGRTDRRDTVRSVSPLRDAQNRISSYRCRRFGPRLSGMFRIRGRYLAPSAGSPTSGLFSPPMGDFNPCDWLLIPPHRRTQTSPPGRGGCVRVWCGDFVLFACSLYLCECAFSCRQVCLFMHRMLSVCSALQQVHQSIT